MSVELIIKVTGYDIDDALDGGDWNNLETLFGACTYSIEAMKVAFNGQDSLPAIVAAYKDGKIGYFNSEYLGGVWLAVNNDATSGLEVVNIEVQFPWENTVSHLKVVAALSCLGSEECGSGLGKGK